MTFLSVVPELHVPTKVKAIYFNNNFIELWLDKISQSSMIVSKSYDGTVTRFKFKKEYLFYAFNLFDYKLSEIVKEKKQ